MVLSFGFILCGIVITLLGLYFFPLAFIGVSCLFVGFAGMLVTDLPAWGHWVVFYLGSTVPMCLYIVKLRLKVGLNIGPGEQCQEEEEDNRQQHLLI